MQNSQDQLKCKIQLITMVGLAGILFQHSLNLYQLVQQNQRKKNEIQQKKVYHVSKLKEIMVNGSVGKQDTDFQQIGNQIIGQSVIVEGKPSQLGNNQNYDKNQPFIQYQLKLSTYQLERVRDKLPDALNIFKNIKIRKFYLDKRLLSIQQEPTIFLEDSGLNIQNKILVKEMENAEIEFTNNNVTQQQIYQWQQQQSDLIIKGVQTGLIVFNFAMQVEKLKNKSIFSSLDRSIGFEEFEFQINFNTPIKLLGEVVIDLNSQTIKVDQIDYIFNSQKFISDQFPTIWNYVQLGICSAITGYAFYRIYRLFQKYQQMKTQNLENGNKNGLYSVKMVFSDIKTNGNCKYCDVSLPNMVIQPCNHICICSNCYTKGFPDQCPFCKTKIHNTARVYVS